MIVLYRKARYIIRITQRKIHHRRLRKSTLNALPYWIAAILTGLMAVAYANIFRIAEGWIISIYSAHPEYAFIGAPLAFLVGWYLVRKFAPAASGSGIPQLLAAAELAGKGEMGPLQMLLGFRVFVVKILSSIACVLGGGAIGREGPTLQLAGSTFYLTHKLLKNTAARYFPMASLQSMIITGGAAGLAAAFNTPLGGIVYAIEELAKVHLSFFRTSLIQAVIVSGLVAQVILGPYLYLGFPSVVTPTLSEVPWMVVVGAVIGLCGALMGRALYSVGQWRGSVGAMNRQALIAVGSGLIFASLVYFGGPVSIGSGKELMTDLLFKSSEHANWGAPILRAFASFFSYASGCAGGIFAPALSTGAALGSLASEVTSGINPHLMVLLGMTAFLTGLTRTPFTAFVLVLEMTDRHSVIFAMMISAMSANAAASLVDPLSLYEKIKEHYLN